ncbi:TPA: hypothetical protein ACX6NR_002873 [Photobacterium damselae]
MPHRKINNVGYKKLYPMSLIDDDSFCHYCGARASITVQLQWDHVPALNVKIPEGCEGIHKTLIRSCAECNNLASDVPHLDYLERHFWLKVALLRRYKRLLLAYDGTKVETKGLSDFLVATINNGEFKYKETMSRIGFGIKDVTEIDSPILSLKNKAGVKLSSALIDYLHGTPCEDDDIDNDSSDGLFKYVDEELGLPPYPYSDFIDFLVTESEVGNAITTDRQYSAWLKDYPQRALILELPTISPVRFYGVSWDKLISDVRAAVKKDQQYDLAREPDISETDNDIKDLSNNRRKQAHQVFNMLMRPKSLIPQRGIKPNQSRSDTSLINRKVDEVSTFTAEETRLMGLSLPITKK